MVMQPQQPALAKKPTLPQQPTYQQPQYAKPAPVKKKSNAPLIIVSIAALCVIAFIAIAISTNFFGFSDGSGNPGDSGRTSTQISSETPAHGTDANGQPGAYAPGSDINGTVSEWPDIIPIYDDGDVTIDVCGEVTGITVLQTGEQYFVEYLYCLTDDGWELEIAPGTDDMFFAWSDDFMISLIYANGAAAIMLCRVAE
jgi:hypothetical protein